VLDVGAYESPYISLFDWIPTKVATDIQLRANVWNDMDGIAFVQGDFMMLNFATSLPSIVDAPGSGEKASYFLFRKKIFSASQITRSRIISHNDS
jgi:hypothetical protein